MMHDTLICLERRENAKMCIFAQKRQHLLNVRMDSCLNFKCNIIQYLLAVCVRYFWCLIHNSLLTHNQLLLSYKPCPNYVLTMSRPCPKIMSETYYGNLFIQKVRYLEWHRLMNQWKKVLWMKMMIKTGTRTWRLKKHKLLLEAGT